MALSHLVTLESWLRSSVRVKILNLLFLILLHLLLLRMNKNLADIQKWVLLLFVNCDNFRPFSSLDMVWRLCVIYKEVINPLRVHLIRDIRTNTLLFSFLRFHLLHICRLHLVATNKVTNYSWFSVFILRLRLHWFPQTTLWPWILIHGPLKCMQMLARLPVDQDWLDLGLFLEANFICKIEVFAGIFILILHGFGSLLVRQNRKHRAVSNHVERWANHIIVCSTYAVVFKYIWMKIKFALFLGYYLWICQVLLVKWSTLINIINIYIVIFYCFRIVAKA